MSLPLRLAALCSLLMTLASCSNAGPPGELSTQPGSTPDPDAVKLIVMSEQAVQIARKVSANVALRQVDTDLSVTDFRFVDSTLTREIMVVVPGPHAPTDKWSTVVNTVSPLLTTAEPAVNLHNLIVGPTRVAHAMTAHWPGCVMRGMNLYRENDQLMWTAFCNTTNGVASGSMDNPTGIFRPSDASLAPLPLTATPVR